MYLCVSRDACNLCSEVVLLFAGKRRVGDHRGVQSSCEEPLNLPGYSDLCRGHVGKFHPLLSSCRERVVIINSNTGMGYATKLSGFIKSGKLEGVFNFDYIIK